MVRSDEQDGVPAGETMSTNKELVDRFNGILNGLLNASSLTDCKRRVLEELSPALKDLLLDRVQGGGGANIVQVMGPDGKYPSETQPMTITTTSAAPSPAPEVRVPEKWAVFCAGCQKHWSVSHYHSGKGICDDCEKILRKAMLAASTGQTKA